MKGLGFTTRALSGVARVPTGLDSLLFVVSPRETLSTNAPQPCCAKGGGGRGVGQVRKCASAVFWNSVFYVCESGGLFKNNFFAEIRSDSVEGS